MAKFDTIALTIQATTSTLSTIVIIITTSTLSTIVIIITTSSPNVENEDGVGLLNHRIGLIEEDLLATDDHEMPQPGQFALVLGLQEAQPTFQSACRSSRLEMNVNTFNIRIYIYDVNIFEDVKTCNAVGYHRHLTRRRDRNHARTSESEHNAHYPSVRPQKVLHWQAGDWH